MKIDTKTLLVAIFLFCSAFWFSVNAQLTEDFESFTSQTTTQAFLGSGTWTLDNADISITVSAGSGKNSFHIQGINQSSGITPIIKYARGNGTISFSAITNNLGSNNGFDVEYSTNGTSFTYLATIKPTSTTVFDTYYVNYNNINADFYIRFIRNNRQFWIDDITITSCNAIPTGISSSAIAATSATISWTGTAASGFDYYYSTSNTPPISTTTVSGSTTSAVKTANLSGLTSGTTYYYWVRGKCNANSYSTWSAMGTFTTLASTCTGTPTAGTTVLTPSTGAPSSAFVATITGGSTGSGLSYQWQIADALAGPYNDISGQTGISANLNAVPLPGTTKYYRRTITCSGSGLSSVSVGIPFTTTTPTYCTPTTASPSKLYISSFKFVGTLNDPPLSANGTGASGYADYTALTPIAQQPDGKVMNVEAISSGSILLSGSYGNGNWKAYVDWNGDGNFVDAGEQVYSLTAFVTNALTFGFVIPAGQAAGKYRFRIIVNNDNNAAFNSCSSFTNGEVEDYSFEVVYNCPASVDAINIAVSDGIRCGTGTVNLSASGTGTNYKWYTTLTGGTAIFTGSNFTTPSLATTTFYYVTAINGSCESAYRIPVTAKIDPEPVVNITAPAPICGTGFSGVQLTSSGDQYVDTIVNEKFDSGLGVFTSSTLGAYTGVSGTWQNRPSPYIPPVPPYEGLAPALSSGYFGGNYAAIITDINRGTSILNALTLTSNADLTNFQDLKLDFDLYYFSITNLPTEGYLKVEYSLDGGGNWNTLSTITSIQGNPNTWSKYSIPIPGPYVSTQFKIRFLLFAYADNVSGNSWRESIATVDNIKLYGTKPITTGFVWSGPANSLYESTCTTLIGTTKTNSICIKPNTTQIENDASWSITATANFANGCPAVKTIVVQNDTKTWDSGTNNWNTNNWKPGGTGIPPTSSKCVIVKTPLIIQTGSIGLAKNVTVVNSGKLTIQPDASLTVTDGFINQLTFNDVILESDSNLKQINDNPSPANFGSVTARRNIKFRSNTTRDEYNYLISPVSGQSLKTLYPGVPTTSTYPYILYHNEANNFFYNSSGAYIAGRGLAVKEPKVADVAAGNKDAEFKGPLANGVVTFPLAFTNSTHGYNLVGNPYASNIDLKALYTLNGSAKISSTFYFWDNGANNVYVQEGNSYAGRAYAVYNAVTDTGNAAGFILPSPLVIGAKVPNKIAKVAQGFMVKTPSAGQTLTFNNSVRVVDNTGVKFFSKDATPQVNRYWLQLISPTNAVNTIAVVYLNEGSTSFGMDDSELNVSSSDMFYSLAEDHQLQIEGRPAFVNSDKIILGSQHFTTGNYTIALGDQEGIFANGQNIYLKDKQTGIVTNLSQGNYTFTANAGSSTGRFDIVYMPETVLATNGNLKESLLIYKNGNDFVVKAQTKKITNLNLFDAAGRLMRSFQPNSVKAVIPADQLSNGVYILKINQNGEITTRKIIR